MMQFESIHDIRRRAPLHFWAKANNAHFAAAVIWKAIPRPHKTLKNSLRYSGTVGTALWESFRRESSIALELIIKAVLAQRIELRRSTHPSVPNSHILEDLWSFAELPALPDDDQKRLVHASSILLWAGRYAAPSSQTADLREQERMERTTGQKQQPGRIHLQRMPRVDWKSFDRIYGIAAREFNQMQNEMIPT